MPLFTLNTNVPTASVPADLATKLSAIVSQLTGKPEQYVFIQINSGQLMASQGTNEPCAVGYLASIGAIGRAENKKSTAALSSEISKTLNIQMDRIMVLFKNLPAEDTSIGGKTFG